MISKTFLNLKINRNLVIIFFVFLVFIIPIITLFLILRTKITYKTKAAPEEVPSCGSVPTLECWGECQPGTTKEYEVCCTNKNSQNQCTAWCRKGLINDNSPNCGGGGGAGTTSQCEGAKNTCCGGQRYMPDGSIGPQPWCHSDDYEYTCNCQNYPAGYYSPCKTGNRCGAYSNTNGVCEKSDCSVSRDPCPPGNVACADDVNCNSDCPRISKQFDVCRGKITKNNCQACQGDCQSQLNQILNGGDCDITCQCVEQLRNEGKLNNNQYREYAGSCAYYFGYGCPNPANFPCSNIQSDVVAWGNNGEWVYLCHSMWEDGRDWWECQATSPTPTPTPTPTPVITATPTPTPTSPEDTPIPTETPTPTPTSQEIPSPTTTSSPTPTSTSPEQPAATFTPLPSETIPTNTQPISQITQQTVPQTGIPRILFFVIPAAIILLGLII